MTVAGTVLVHQMDAIVTLDGEGLLVKTLHALLTAGRTGFATKIHALVDKVLSVLLASGLISMLLHK